MDDVIPAGVAGLFYPADPAALCGAVDAFLEEHPPRPLPSPLRAVIAPHAGYVYSGRTAGAVYAAVRAQASARTFVLLGPAHRCPLAGVAAPAARAAATPLGEVPINTALRAVLLERGLVQTNDRAFPGEHCLEVQLPFLQRAVGEFDIVPLLVGAAAADEVAAVIAAAGEAPGVLIIVSSDLSHYLPGKQAQQIDAATSGLIEALRYEELEPERACGAAAIRGLLCHARRRGWRAQTVHTSSSGEAFGDYSKVVGYGGYAFTGTGIQ